MDRATFENQKTFANKKQGCNKVFREVMPEEVITVPQQHTEQNSSAEKNSAVRIVPGDATPSVWSPLPVLPGVSFSVSSHISQDFGAKIQRKNESSKDYPLKILACYNLTHVLEYSRSSDYNLRHVLEYSRSSGYNLRHVLEYSYSPVFVLPPGATKKRRREETCSALIINNVR